MLQNPRKTLGFKKNMVYKIPPGGGGKPYPASGLQSLKLLRPTVIEKMHLQESTLFDLDLQVKVTLNVAQCPLHHVTYAPTEFEVTTSKALGGEAFTRKFNI